MLTVNESREQTEEIHHAQRLKRTLKGLESKIKKEEVLKLHRNAQRLLKPLAVINPYADQLTFLSDKTRTRRDHEKYLTLIDSIALLHQAARAFGGCTKNKNKKTSWRALNDRTSIASYLSTICKMRAGIQRDIPMKKWLLRLLLALLILSLRGDTPLKKESPNEKPHWGLCTKKEGEC